MRPVIRPDGNYHNVSMTAGALAGGIGQNHPTRCLALCIEEEINRLHAIIAALPAAGGEAAVAVTVAGVISATAIPVAIPALVVPAVPAAGGFAGGTYAAALNALPAAHQAIVDNYLHYGIIQRNLQYAVPLDGWIAGTGPRLVIGDIPYAVSAMQDTREQIRAAGAGAVLHGHGGATIGPPPAGVAVRTFTLANINTHINTLYNAWLTRANSNPARYTDAAAELVNELGPYCAYCEANLKTQIDVEHMLPKGRGNNAGGVRQGFPSLAKSWFNFLPACPRCNSTKNARPDKLDITNKALAARAGFSKDDITVIGGIALNVGGGDSRITDIEYTKIYRNYYQFPLEQDSYRNVGYALWNHGTGFPDNTTLAMQRAWTIHSIDEVNKAVRVNTGAAVINNYQVFIDDRSFGTGHPLATPAAAVNKVSNMADICGLNATNANTDRRVLERTEAWFMALEAVNRINNDLGGLPGGTTQAVMNLVYALWRDSVISMIKEKGFLTVWLKIFSAFPHPLAPRGPTFPNPLSGNEVGGAAAGALMNLGQDIATQIRNARYFPNTNFAQLP